MSKRGAMTCRQVIRLLKNTALSRTIILEAIAFCIIRKPEGERLYPFTPATCLAEHYTAF